MYSKAARDAGGRFFVTVSTHIFPVGKRGSNKKNTSKCNRQKERVTVSCLRQLEFGHIFTDLKTLLCESEG